MPHERLLTPLDATLEHQARARARTLEDANQLPQGFTEHHYPLTAGEQRELRRLKAALAAAVDADTFVALAKGEPVPANRLNQEVVRHQHRRHA